MTAEDLPEPAAWHRGYGFTFHFSLGPERPKNSTSNPNEWIELFTLDQLLAERQRADRAEQDLRIAQGNTDAAISDYNGALKRLKEAEAIISRIADVYKDMEDGNGEPCPDLRAAAKFMEEKP